MPPVRAYGALCGAILALGVVTSWLTLAGASLEKTPLEPMKTMSGKKGEGLSFPGFPCPFTVEIYDRTGGGMADHAVVSLDLGCVREMEEMLRGGTR